MDQFDVELDRLAWVGYYDLPPAAEQVGIAELHVARCDGLQNRRLFVEVDETWETLRDDHLRRSLRKLTETILATGDALRIVHARYGGTDQSQAAGLQRLEDAARSRGSEEAVIVRQRALEEDYFDVGDRRTVDELSDEAVHDAVADDRFVPWEPD